MDGVTFLVLVCPILLDRGGGILRGWGGFLQSLHALLTMIRTRRQRGWGGFLQSLYGMLCVRFHLPNNWRGYVVSLQYIFCNVMPKAWLER